MDDLTLINNTSAYRNPAPQSPLQGPNVMQPAAVYSKIMLRTIELSESDYVFDSIATEKTMPSNNGSNEIIFKRMLSLAAHTQPLVEGIPPASDKGAMVAIKGSTKSYGRVMKFTDKVNWAVVDPLIAEYTRQLSLKIPETKDILAQEALLAECQVFYAQPKVVYSGAGDPDTLVIDTTKPTVSHIDSGDIEIPESGTKLYRHRVILGTYSPGPGLTSDYGMIIIVISTRSEQFTKSNFYSYGARNASSTINTIMEQVRINGSSINFITADCKYNGTANYPKGIYDNDGSADLFDELSNYTNWVNLDFSDTVMEL